MNKNYLFYGLSIVISLLLGYWLGTRCSDPTCFPSCDPDYVTADYFKRDKEKMELISFEEAKALDLNFKLYKNCKLTPEVRAFFENPLDIYNAKEDFEKIFCQRGYAGLRAYPGVKYDPTKEDSLHFTMIFVGIDKNKNPIFNEDTCTSPGDIARPTLPTEQLPPPIQDNNSPCRPCGSLF